MIMLGCRLACVVAVVLLAVPSAAGAVTARAGSYVGTPSRGGTVLVSIAPGGRQMPGFSVVEGVATRADGCAGGRYGTSIGPIIIRPSGRFVGNYPGEVGMVVHGRITRSGLVRGRLFYEDRSGCVARDTFTSQLAQGLTGRGPRIFNMYGGDGTLTGGHPPATEAGDWPHGVAEVADGSLVIADSSAPDFASIFGVSPFGRATRLGGGTIAGDRGDGGPIATARFNSPQGVAALPDGGYLIADPGSACVREVNPVGIITTAAGICTNSGDPPTTPPGDGGPATAARLNDPEHVAALPGGGFLISEIQGNRVREVAPDGTITTVAGTGRLGFSGDGGPATAAHLNGPGGVSALPGGGFLVADTYNGRVRKVAPDGTVTTVAGGGRTTLARGIGDGGPATRAVLANPVDVVARPAGGFLVADSAMGNIREVALDGTITTIEGNGPLGLGAHAADASTGPAALTLLSDGGIALADSFGRGVDEIAPVGTPRLLIAMQPSAVTVRSGSRVALHVLATRSARLTIDVTTRRRHHLQTVRRSTFRARAGITRLSLRGFAAGEYRLRVVAAAGVRIATASVDVSIRSGVR